MNIKRPEPKQSMPADATCVFKGEIFNVFQWQQKLFDESQTTFERVKRVDTVGVLPITSEGKIILSKQEQPGMDPFIGVIGGRIDPGEDPLNAIKRELVEETGYTAGEWILWDAVQLLEKFDWAIYNFVAKKLTKQQTANPDLGEKIELIEVTFDEFIRLAAQKNYRDIDISLKLFQILSDPHELEKTKELFS